MELLAMLRTHAVPPRESRDTYHMFRGISEPFFLFDGSGVAALLDMQRDLPGGCRFLSPVQKHHTRSCRGTSALSLNPVSESHAFASLQGYLARSVCVDGIVELRCQFLQDAPQSELIKT